MHGGSGWEVLGRGTAAPWSPQLTPTPGSIDELAVAALLRSLAIDRELSSGVRLMTCSDLIDTGDEYEWDRRRLLPRPLPAAGSPFPPGWVDSLRRAHLAELRERYAAGD
jgi:hypothetical protein